MGVPKFYRWLSERYPKINEIVSDQALLPEFDHLYLDLNGVIHGCTHPSHLDVSGEVLSEREMMLGIMHYMDRVITQIVKPQVSVYIAIDGVAPRAKLNQQRSRRFRSAQELIAKTAQQQEQQKKQQQQQQKNSNNNNNKNQKGQAAASSSSTLGAGGGGTPEIFDSNCITPGTEFLDRVSDCIQYFIRKKIKEDPLWQKLTIIFSGSNIPGEGEHKIMSHIREMKSQIHYQPNTRHCMYGQDADLIMLALVSHEPHFTILREVVQFSFGGNNNDNNKNTLKAVKKFTKESDFQLLHISILREYLQMEFGSPLPPPPLSFSTLSLHDAHASTAAAATTTCRWDLERIIDDFVFMTFLVGNDFLPHMPTLDIGEGAFDLLFSIYKEQRQVWNNNRPDYDPNHLQYLTSSGGIISDPMRLENFLAAIGAVESQILEQREKDVAIYIKKKRRWDKRDGKPDGPSDAAIKADEDNKQNDYLSMIEHIMSVQRNSINGNGGHVVEGNQLNTNLFVEGWKPVTEPGQKDFKGRYYYEKLHLTPIDKEKHWALRKSYVEGLIWCLAYYYRGCISWEWYYPYHYGPMLSDLLHLPQIFAEIKFELGSPLPPYQQLLACLPPASGTLVPKLYRWLMISPESPIIHFYPTEFEVDMNGKKNPWEGVNLLPFIDVQLLKNTVAIHCPSGKLHADEQRRNTFGSIFCYQYDKTCTDTVPCPIPNIGLPDIVSSHSIVRSIQQKESDANLSFESKLVPGTRIPYPGFPSLNVLPIASFEPLPIGLNCFGTPSKYATMVLTLHTMPELPPIEELASRVLGQSLYVNWPMMHEGRVVSMSNAQKEIRLVNSKLIVKEFDKITADRWLCASETMAGVYYMGNGIPGSGGVQIGDVTIRLKLLPLQGMKTNPANGSKTKLFGQQEADVPLQLALWQAPAPDPRFMERGPLTLKERFPPGCSVVLTKGKYKGCKGIAVAAADKNSVVVNVQIIPAEIPFGLAIARSVQESYLSSSDAARTLRMNPGVFGKVTGRLPFEQGRYDLGLNLKSVDGLCVIGYTRRKIETTKSKGKNGKAEVRLMAWEAGDSLRVIGSASRQDDDDREERIQWEYTPQAIRLVDLYRKKFPQLFAEISKDPMAKKYDANRIFGPNGESWLPIVREWLDNHETAKLPRSPITTLSMSYEAVAAVQKAADVRTLALKKRGYPKESTIKIPGVALYREASTTATDVLLASDLNNNEAPELGDRIVNLCADGVPFGARGTVVGINDAATAGSVEVVMDEEFIGGSTLQGACSNFRGKLCAWTDLLRIVPENSKSLVEKLVPKGAGQAALDKIMASIDRDTKATDSTASVKGDGDGKVDSPSMPDVPTLSPSTKAMNSERPEVEQVASVVTMTASNVTVPASTQQRSGSTGQGKQGTWREALGPNEKGFGFEKGQHTNRTGFEMWKEIVTLHKSDTTMITHNNESARLKAILGLTPSSTATSSTAVVIEPEGSSLSNVGLTYVSEVDASAGLKALLGVSQITTAVQPSQLAPVVSWDATAGLKAIMGISSAPVFAPNHSNLDHASLASSTIPSVPNHTPTAAERLLQLMVAKQPVLQTPVASKPQPSPFNFTYVDQGAQQQGTGTAKDSFATS